ncbi:MAG: glycoside hydrolase family 27 protein [Anaerolineales bacterium]|nr:glycoside hydrolase family 27 protein [Anaerolineales bacterium]
MTLAQTPPMGWNSWNMFGGTLNAALIKQTADAFVSTGLRDAGYTYIVIDDLWQQPERVNGRLAADPQKFPEGIKAIADYVHERGLKIGLYSDAGTRTCGGRPASQDYEDIDAQTFAEWEIDFLKYDWCNAEDTRANAEHRYQRISDALKASGREIILSICEWGHHRPWLWGRKVGGHLWRTTGDIADSWHDVYNTWGIVHGIESIGFEQQRGLESYAGPGGWNDPDMLVVGIRGQSHEIVGAGCTDTEYRTHFSLWCLLAAPLMIGCDVTQIDAATLEILTNRDLIALNQDPLGRQGFRVARHGQTEIWKKPLANGELAVALFNRADKRQTVRAHWSDLEITGTYQGRDLWAGVDLGSLSTEISAAIPPHGCAVYRLTPN